VANGFEEKVDALIEKWQDIELTTLRDIQRLTLKGLIIKLVSDAYSMGYTDRERDRG
jgi:hypothetical protein